MGDAAQGPGYGLAIAVAAAVLLFGVFLFNGAVRQRLRAWWRGLALHPFDGELVPPASGPRGAGRPDRGGARVRTSRPHAEKKEAPAHRQG